MRTPQSHTAREDLPSQSALEDRRIPVQAKLAAAWTSFMFLYIYVDYFHLYKPGAIDQIRGGVISAFDISPTLLTIFLTSVAIPALMVMLSMTLPARVNRATNLVFHQDQQISTATRAQSRGLRSAAFVGRGSAHSAWSALVAI